MITKGRFVGRGVNVRGGRRLSLVREERAGLSSRWFVDGRCDG